MSGAPQPPVDGVGLPSADALLAAAAVVSLPMTTRFRGIEVREAMLLRGPAGWTEFSPFLEYDDAEAAAWLRAAIDFGWQSYPVPEGALVPVNATLPAVEVEAVAEVLSRFAGTRTVKVKVAERGQTLSDDLARLTEVRRIVGPEGRIRIDSNGGWNVDEAEHALRALSVIDLEYVEQPCASIDELAELRERIADLAIPVAADESVRKAADPLLVARQGGADLLVVKAQPLGGISAAMRIVADAGLPVVVSSALDTSVGISMGAHLAHALGDAVAYDCGLGTAALFVDDVTAHPLLPDVGAIPVRRVEVDADAVARLAAAPDRVTWWHERLRRCHALLSAAPAPPVE